MTALAARLAPASPARPVDPALPAQRRLFPPSGRCPPPALYTHICAHNARGVLRYRDRFPGATPPRRPPGKGLPVRLGIGYLRDDSCGVPRLVGAAGDQLVDIARAAEAALRRRGASRGRAAQLAAAAFPASLTQVLSGGSALTDAVRRLLDEPAEDSWIDPGGMHLDCPVDPPSYRDFMSFDEHVRNTYAPGGRPPPEVLYQLPAYYKGSTATLIGPGDEVRWPHYAATLDYELEFALVIGTAGVDLAPSSALDHVFGVTVLSDFSARDKQISPSSSGCSSCVTCSSSWRGPSCPSCALRRARSRSPACGSSPCGRCRT